MIEVVSDLRCECGILQFRSGGYDGEGSTRLRLGRGHDARYTTANLHEELDDSVISNTAWEPFSLEPSPTKNA